MAKFNKAKISTSVPTTKNLAGGDAFEQSPKLELASILLTSFVADQYYRKADDTLTRLRELVAQVDPKFAAKAAIYARNRFGMRSITHVVSAEIANKVKGETWTRDFFDKVVNRPDDITETLSLFMSVYGKRKLPNALKDGFARRLARFDAYQIAKYKGEGKSLKLIDAVRLCHPKRTEAIDALYKGTLAPANTWEVAISEAGKAGSDEEKSDLKDAAWATLLKDGKLGYLAALRNISNIVEQSPASVDLLIALLTNPEVVKKSRVFPFQFLTAYEQFNGKPGTKNILDAIAKATEISLSNVPHFSGRTLVALDSSGSMGGGYGFNKNQHSSPGRIGAMFGVVLARSNDADFMTFDSNAKYVSIPSNADIYGAMERVKFPGGTTNFHTVFDTAKNEKYDRIIFISDMQGWVTGRYASSTPMQTSLAAYRKRTGVNPFIYSFDLSGYGTSMFPEDRVLTVAGFSDKILDTLALVETDRNALVHEIEAIEL